jgi:GntP family gluconate:H+ symporter
MLPPLLLLLLAMATVVGAIVLLRLDAFLALLVGALLVSLLAPGEPAEKVVRVAEGFGRTAGNVGIVIALASIIGAAMLASGAADRIVRAFLALLGERRGAAALGATGFVLSIPVFFDTVFFLLVPLARSMHRRSGRQYLKYLMAIAGGAAATHTLVPPTPGPLAVASLLGVDLGTMVLVGVTVALPGAVAAYFFAGLVDARMPVTPTLLAADPVAPDDDAPDAAPLPALLPSVAPIVVPVLLISSHTLATSLGAGEGAAAAWWAGLLPFTAVVGNANLALLVATALALFLYASQRRASRAEVATLTERSLASAGPIILITAAGGAFGATLQAAQVGPAIQALFAGREGTSGVAVLLLGFAVASLIKIAQGSSTVAMITTGGMLAAMLQDAPLPFDPVYLATAIGAGSLVGTWMNDSGFWVFSRLGGVSEVQTLKTWTPLAAIVGLTAMAATVVLSRVLPLR